MSQSSAASSRRARRVALTAAAVATALLAAACSSSSANSSSSAPASSPAAASTASLAAFEAKVNQVITQRSAPITTPPPSSGPTAAKGKTVYVIACIMAAEGCARETRTAVAAAQAIGWNVKMIDTGSVPSKMADAVQQAINNHADGIIIEAIDYKFIAGPLAQAKAAGIKIVSFAAVPVNNLADQVIPSEQAFVDDGYAIGAQMYKNTNGHPRLVVMYDPSFGVTGWRLQGTKKFFDDCVAAGGDCKILATNNYLVNELSTRVPALAAQAAQQYPDMNAMWMSYDSAESFLAQGLRQAGVTPGKVGLYGFDGNAANIHAIRSNDFEVATMAGPFEWIGWAEVDGLNRLFQGQAPVEGVIQTKLITPANVPASDTWVVDIPFETVQADYKKVWGV